MRWPLVSRLARQLGGPYDQLAGKLIRNPIYSHYWREFQENIPAFLDDVQMDIILAFWLIIEHGGDYNKLVNRVLYKWSRLYRRKVKAGRKVREVYYNTISLDMLNLDKKEVVIC